MKHIRWEKLWNDPDGKKYKALNTVSLISSRFHKQVTVPKGYKSDGATNAIDRDTDAWGFHDVLCDRGTWDDGTPVCNLDASLLLFDVLWRDGYRRIAFRWFFATFLFGGGKARKNGLWRVNVKKTED
jgi:hypothetical protein